MAKNSASTKNPDQGNASVIKVRVLVASALGDPNDVIQIDAEQVVALAGFVDADPDAVAYAESLT